MSSSSSLHELVVRPTAWAGHVGVLDDLLGLDAQKLLLVVPLVERLGLIEALVALQPDEPAAGHSGDGLGEFGLARAGRALDEHRLGEPVRQVDDSRDPVVGEVAASPRAVREPRHRSEQGGPGSGNQDSRTGQPERPDLVAADSSEHAPRHG